MKLLSTLILITILIACSSSSGNTSTAPVGGPPSAPTPTPAKTTFTKDILPLIQANCTNCHSPSGRTDYKNYSASESAVDLLINRLNRTPGSQGFMPNSGSNKLTSMISKLEKWKSDGLVNN